MCRKRQEFINLFDFQDKMHILNTLSQYIHDMWPMYMVFRRPWFAKIELHRL